MKNISKEFPGVKALSDVSFLLDAGEVHVLIGENGAGKSTLMKILSGNYHQDSGEILIDGEPVVFKSPIDAIRKGVVMIYQELTPEKHLTVAENIFLGKQPVKAGMVDYKSMHSQARGMLDRFGLQHISTKALMNTLSVAETQMIEIVKAASFDARILIMDEPTSALSDHEIDKLFEIVKMLRDQGVGIIYISHKMDEIWRVGDRITVLRDGRYIDTRPLSEVDIDEVIRMMVGRDLSAQFPKEEVEIGGEIMRVEGLDSAEGKFHDISFTLRKGEILGIAGLMGAGRSEVVETIFGIRRKAGGRIFVNGKEVAIKKPRQAMNAGMALVSEDRKGIGLNLKASVKSNITLCYLRELSKGGFMNRKAEVQKTDEEIRALSIKTPDRDQIVSFLSGGNQQKVVVGKWLMTDPEIIILDEPTRGIDVGAKAEIHQIITNMVKEGKGVIMVSSELPEVIGMCDRVLVMHEGELTGEIDRASMTQELIMKYATGEGDQT